VPPKYGVRLPRWVIALGAIVLYTSEVAIAESPAERHGLRFARLHRAPCHAIDRVGESPLPIAPPFRALRLKYFMPRFHLEPEQVSNLMAYLKTLAR
jgi:cytochrome c